MFELVLHTLPVSRMGRSICHIRSIRTPTKRDSQSLVPKEITSWGSGALALRAIPVMNCTLSQSEGASTALRQNS